MTYKRFDINKFHMEYYLLLKNKESSKEEKELRKFLRTNRKQNMTRIIVLPKLNEIETKMFQKDSRFKVYLKT